MDLSAWVFSLGGSSVFTVTLSPRLKCMEIDPSLIIFFPRAASSIFFSWTYLTISGEATGRARK